KHNIERVAGKEVKTNIWQGKEVQFAAREIAVKISASATQSQINSLLNAIGGQIKNKFDERGWGLVELPADKDEISTVDDLIKLPFVLSAEPNMVTRINLEPNDPYFTDGHQWALKNTGQNPPAGTNDADIDADEAWNITTGNSDIIIAILDTGIPMLNGSLSHPDLDDENKIILGSDWTDETDGTVKDNYGHGTHVAGIAAAESNNGTGIAGVAWNCKIMPIQVFDAYGSGYFSYFYNGVVEAVNYQRNNPGKKVVINYSGGGGASQQALDAVIYANTYGVPIIASAGNEDGGSVLYPAAYSSSYSNVIAVSSTDANDTFSSFSSQGLQVCVSAPGGYGYHQVGYVVYYNDATMLGKNVYSTTPNYTFNIAVDPLYAGDPYSTDVTQNYGYMPGTSMAAPHVSGIAGLILSVNPNLTPSQVRTIIQQSAEDKGTTGFDNYYGYGRVNAARAVKTVVAPTNVHFANSSGYVTIAWDPHPSPILSYYSIERKINNGSWTVIATTTSTSFTDREVRFSTDPSRPMVYYRITAISTGNIQSLYSTVISTRGQYIPFNTDEQFVALPSEFRFEQNVPNPFNPSTVLRFDLPEQSTVVLRIYNSIGQEVAELINGVRAAGKHSIRWNASTLPSGMYLARLDVGNKTYVKKMSLLK
ncbi:MAG: S8 family serine peptidase, partial [Bacteroidota bacterium]